MALSEVPRGCPLLLVTALALLRLASTVWVCPLGVPPTSGNRILQLLWTLPLHRDSFRSRGAEPTPTPVLWAHQRAGWPVTAPHPQSNLVGYNRDAHVIQKWFDKS